MLFACLNIDILMTLFSVSCGKFNVAIRILNYFLHEPSFDSNAPN